MAHAGLSSPRAFPPVPHSSPTDFGRLVLIVIIFPGILDGTADDIGRMIRTVRLITAIGNSLGVTLPRHLLKACGLHRGSLVEVLPANNGLLVRPSRIVPVELADRLRDVFLRMHQDEQGRAILGRLEVDAFEAGDPEDYRSIEEMVDFVERP